MGYRDFVTVHGILSILLTFCKFAFSSYILGSKRTFIERKKFIVFDCSQDLNDERFYQVVPRSSHPLATHTPTAPQSKQPENEPTLETTHDNSHLSSVTSHSPSHSHSFYPIAVPKDYALRTHNKGDVSAPCYFSTDNLPNPTLACHLGERSPYPSNDYGSIPRVRGTVASADIVIVPRTLGLFDIVIGTFLRLFIHPPSLLPIVMSSFLVIVAFSNPPSVTHRKTPCLHPNQPPLEQDDKANLCSPRTLCPATLSVPIRPFDEDK